MYGRHIKHRLSTISIGIALVTAAACGAEIGQDTLPAAQQPDEEVRPPDGPPIGDTVPLPPRTGPMLEGTLDTAPPPSPYRRTADEAKKDRGLRDDRARFGLATDKSTFERAIDETFAREATGDFEDPIGVALTDEELKAVLEYTESQEQRHRLGDFLRAHGDTTALFLYNDDIDDPHFTIQLTDRFPDELRAEVSALVPDFITHSFATVEYSSDEIHEYGTRISETLRAGKPDDTGVVRAAERAGLRPIRVEWTGASQAVTLVVDKKNESRADAVLSDLVARDRLPEVARDRSAAITPVAVVKGEEMVTPEGRLDSPGQAKGGLRLSLNGYQCTSAGSISIFERRFTLTAGHCTKAPHVHPAGTTYGTSLYSWRNTEGNASSVWALDYQAYELDTAHRGLAGPYVMTVSAYSGTAYYQLMTGEYGGVEQLYDYVCYEGASSNRQTYASQLGFGSIPYRTVCGSVIDDRTDYGRVQLNTKVCLGDSGGTVRNGGTMYGIVSRSVDNIAGTGGSCQNKMSYSRIEPILDQISPWAYYVRHTTYPRTGQLVTVNSGRCLSASNSGLANWIDYLQWDCLYNPYPYPHGAQSFHFEPVYSSSSSDLYRLIRYNGSAKTCVSVDGTTGGGGYQNWAQIHVWGCIGSTHPHQTWRLRHHSNTGNDGRMRIESIGSGRCMSVPYSQQQNGVQMHLWDCYQYNPAQQWSVR